jgi:aminoglycoside phosphotransferase (APT) family kinase protein
LLPVAQQLHDIMGAAPVGLVHGDCHLENSYFLPGTKELGMYDMQLMRVGKGAIDLASFVSLFVSFDIANFRRSSSCGVCFG